MSKKFRLLLMACVTMLLCVSAISVGSYALFTDSVVISNHLEAGELNITLKRVYLEYDALDGDGYISHGQSDEEVDFTENTDRNIFDIADDTLIVPCCYYEATMKIENNSNVAFGYWIDVVLKDGTPTELEKQLKVEVTTYDENNEPIVSDSYITDGLSVGSENNFVGTLATTSNFQTFKVKVTFVNDRDVTDINNNLAMGENVMFDVVVSAVQLTEAAN